ncbi:hypothetical protein MMC30_000168 [Trapelia coarctata]|nr:hypothetical protein [Trapelia coarctata]
MIQEFAEPPQPEFRRAIFFPSDQEFPRFIWIETKEHCSGTFAWMDLTEQLDLEGDKLFNVRTSTALPPVNDLRSKRALRHKLVVHYRDHFLIDGSTPNQSIFQATKGKQKKAWNGPLVVLALKVNGTRDPPFDHVTAHDLRDLVDWFCRFDGNASSVSPLVPVIDINAVRISSPDTMRITGCQQLSPVVIKSNHPIFSQEVKMDKITMGLGPALHVYQLARKWESYNHINYNLPAYALDLSVSGPGYGKPSWEWEGVTGNRSALVARIDKRDLWPHHVYALARYCENEIARPTLRMPDWDTIRKHLKEMCRKESFEQFWNYMSAMKQTEALQRNPLGYDPTWLNVPSPFKVSGGQPIW